MQSLFFYCSIVVFCRQKRCNLGELLLLLLGRYVGIDVHGGGQLSMSQDLLCRLGWDSSLPQDCGIGVANGVPVKVNIVFLAPFCPSLGKCRCGERRCSTYDVIILFEVQFLKPLLELRQKWDVSELRKDAKMLRKVEKRCCITLTR